MNSLFIANFQLNEHEGIYKKVLAQANGLKNSVGGRGWMITRKEKHSVIYDLETGEKYRNEKSVLYAAFELINKHEINTVYVRHMIPSIKLIQFLKNLRNKNIKIFYEIPTYPYFIEQFRTSKKKHRAIAKLTLDTVFWPFIYRYIDKLVVIKSNTKVKMYKKMVQITNGVFVDNISTKSYSIDSNEKFSMVAVGTLYPYHGYDRILQGLKKCNEKIDGKIVEFNVVGSSDTINDLKKQADTLGLKYVKFLGVKSTEELNCLFEKIDVGLGCLALHRRNADIDTTIKIIEYYSRGIPVVTSGFSPMDNYCEKYTIHLEDSEEAVEIEKIYLEYSKLTTHEKMNISKLAKNIFSWNNIMNKLLEN